MTTHIILKSVALGAILLIFPMSNLIAASDDNLEQQLIAVLRERVVYKADLYGIRTTDVNETSSSLSMISLFASYVQRMIVDEEIEARQISVSSNEVTEAVIKSLERMNITEMTFPKYRAELHDAYNDMLLALQKSKENREIVQSSTDKIPSDIDEQNAREAEIRTIKASIPDTFNGLVWQSFNSMKRGLEIERLTSSLIESKDIDNNDRKVDESSLYRKWLYSRMQKLDISFHYPGLEDAWKIYFTTVNGKVEHSQPKSADFNHNGFEMPSPQSVSGGRAPVKSQR